MPKLSSLGHFSYDIFEETPNEKVVNMSKLTKPYFNTSCQGSFQVVKNVDNKGDLKQN